jgi:predicted ATPase
MNSRLTVLFGQNDAQTRKNHSKNDLKNKFHRKNFQGRIIIKSMVQKLKFYGIIGCGNNWLGAVIAIR